MGTPAPAKTQVAAPAARAPASAGRGLLQRTCACGTHTVAGVECAACGKARLQRRLDGGDAPPNQTVGLPQSARGVSNPAAGRPPGVADARAFKSPRFGHDFSRVRAHTGGRASRPAGAADTPLETPGRLGPHDQRMGFDEDPHRPMIDAFREEQGQPPGGVDEEGSRVGPSDAEIKYRPQPIAVLNGPFHAPIDEPKLVGMEIEVSVQSSSSNKAYLATVQESEKVGPSFDHTGTLAGTPVMASSQSGFMSAANLPNDRHYLPRAQVISHVDSHPGDAGFSKHQLDIYTDARHGVLTPIAIPNSGYKIVRKITTGPGTRIVHSVDKMPEACTVDGYAAAAGPSPAYHDEVVVRP